MQTLQILARNEVRGAPKLAPLTQQEGSNRRQPVPQTANFTHTDTQNKQKQSLIFKNFLSKMTNILISFIPLGIIFVIYLVNHNISIIFIVHPINDST